MSAPAHRRRSVATLIVSFMLLAELSACGNRDRSDRAVDGQPGPSTSEQTGLVRSVASADSGRVALAESAFLQWLASSAETGTGAKGGTIEREISVRRCNDGDSFPSPLLATWQLLPSQMRGDTVVVHANVTTVAEQDEDRRQADRFTARQRVRTDVLEWDMIETADGWMVCNGIQFGYVGADSLTRWLPPGASIGSARALADSIYRASHGNSAR